MKRFVRIIVLSALFAGIAQAAFAQTFSVQAVWRDRLGKIVADGSYSLTFRLYDRETGGTVLWTETHSGVQVKHGVYAVNLGEINSLSTLDFTETYWLSVAVNGGAELSPRIKLTHSPYTMSATGADKVFPSAGNVGIGTKTPETALYVTGSGDVKITVNSEAGNASGLALSADNDRKWEIHRDPVDNSLDITETGVGEAVSIQSGGKVGIGTTSPETELHVSGNVIADGQIRTTADTSGLVIGENFFIGGIDPGKIGIKAGNEWRLSVTDDGNVGIGTTNPVQPLHIDGNLKISAPDGNIEFTDGSTLSTADIFEGGVAGSMSGYGDVFITADSDSDRVGAIRLNIADSTHVVITADGKVGVGTENPARTLDVNGDIGFSGDLMENGTPFSSGVWTATYTDTVIEHQASFFESFEDGNADGWTSNYWLTTTTGAAYDGSFSLRIRYLHYVETTFEVDSPTIFFYHVAIYEGGYSGGVRVYFNGTYFQTITSSGYGEFKKFSRPLSPGTYTVRFECQSSSAYLDYLYTDDYDYSGPTVHYTDGSVGIGTSAPGYTLDVEGSLNAASLLIDGEPLPDYGIKQTPWIVQDNRIRPNHVSYNVHIGETPTYGYWGAAGRLAVWDVAYINGVVFSGGAIYPYYGTNGYSNSKLGDITNGNLWTSIYVTDVYYYNLVHNSDSRVKRNIRPLSNALNKILRLNGVRYTINPDTHPAYKNSENKAEIRERDELGFVAQELKEVIPEMVEKDEETGLHIIRNYHQMYPVLGEAIKEFKTELIDPLEKEVGELEEKLERLLEEK